MHAAVSPLPPVTTLLPRPLQTQTPLPLVKSVATTTASAIQSVDSVAARVRTKTGNVTARGGAINAR